MTVPDKSKINMATILPIWIGRMGGPFEPTLQRILQIMHSDHLCHASGTITTLELSRDAVGNT